MDRELEVDGEVKEIPDEIKRDGDGGKTFRQLLVETNFLQGTVAPEKGQQDSQNGCNSVCAKLTYVGGAYCTPRHRQADVRKEKENQAKA